jgi:glycosyltransferase involved in cell wall biosynthesis
VSFSIVKAPTWSVMVPVYNRTRHLTEALDSVVAQPFDRERMQIEVIDNCSIKDDVSALIKTRYGERISFYRQPEHVSMAENWNTCIERAKGTLVHILHDDDFVAHGYYAEIESLADKYPGVSLYATRNFFVDDESIITGVSGRIRELEGPTKVIDSFLYETPIQCAAVTVRRTAYEALGGFRSDMGFVVDCEMWARVTSSGGAILSSKVLASHRMSDDTDTHRVLRSAQGIKDICHLNELFARQYPSFCVELGHARVSAMAWDQYRKFKWLGDEEAAAANYALWAQLTPLTQRIARFVSRAVEYIRKAYRLGFRGTISLIGTKLF